MPLLPSSEAKLVGVHPDLVRVIRRASDTPLKANGATLSFIVTEGLRDIERQKKLVAAGASQTMNSRHLTGHAVDIAPWLDVDGDNRADSGEVRWDWPLYWLIAPVVKAAARAEGVPIVWGGDWKKFRDGPHFELPVENYPR